MRRISALALFALPLALAAARVCARTPDAGSAASSQPREARVQGDTPRSTVASFLLLCRQGEYAAAARYLQLSAAQTPRAAELAKRLKLVLDRHLWIDLNALSDRPNGERDDDLPENLDEIGRIPNAGRGASAVRLVHVGGEPAWLFSHSTVNHIDAWYAGLSRHWLLEHLPEFLLRPGPGDLLWWQWLALPLLALCAWPLSLALSRILQALLARVAARTRTQWDDALLPRIRPPLRVTIAFVLLALALPLIGLYPPAEALGQRLLRVGSVIALFWMLARCVEVAEHVIAGSPWATRAAASSVVRLGARVSKVAVWALALVAVLSSSGYSVASLLAGLGIGGLAVALAAQKTLENLFGAFSIAVDQPFREGDFVKVEDFVGTVERIGLRSTKIRTLDRTLISLPNGKLADMRLESFAARDRIRFSCTLGLVYETSAAQMRNVLVNLERALRAHPKIWPEAVVVRFVALSNSSLDVDVMAWFLTSDWNEFQTIRQDMLLEFMRVVEQAGSSFAFPTQTLHVLGVPARRALRREPSGGFTA